ncbi:hypothetical protein DICVIV_13075 [Dictyocaulus viviparus]|uniref:Uncharacterized protein n=1 Tax=Dictyocaulus viviparus TaxID=29172 RepID=A0A0D8XB05_DICVI|nr:hypothetical protein DICVIV_13075 [Dictyocaulus viviparus]
MDEKVPGLKAIKEGSTGERSPASPRSEENHSDNGEDHVDRAPKGWERRQQDGEYDSVSISSSLVRGGKRAASETVTDLLCDCVTQLADKKVSVKDSNLFDKWRNSSQVNIEKSNPDEKEKMTLGLAIHDEMDSIIKVKNPNES